MEYNKDFIQEDWIKGKIDIGVINKLEGFGKFLADQRDNKWNTGLTTNQLRKFFGEVKRQQAKGYNSIDFALLKPKLAYAVGKAKTKEGKIHEFYHVIAGAIEKVSSLNDFNNFIKIFEAIVAYHRATEDSKLN